MESKLNSEPAFKANNFRDESLKSFSPSKIYHLEMQSKKTSQFKIINRNSKELFISTKKNMNSNQIKPKLLKGSLPSVFNIIEKRYSSYDKKEYSEKKFNNSNININKERKDESPKMKIKEYASNTEQKRFKNYNPKINNYFREKALSPPIKQLNPVKEKNNDLIIISEVNLNENGDEIDSKTKTNFSDFETRTLIRNKTIATNFSSIGFDIMNEKNNHNDYNNKFNAWNGNNNLNIINNMNKNNKNQIANLYKKQFFPYGNETKNNNKKYDNINIEKKIIIINKIKINLLIK